MKDRNSRLELPRAEIFVDGACSGNPGPGGWGAIIRTSTKKRELSGGLPSTTNNQMELMAAIKALEWLKRPGRIQLYSDSKYVIDGSCSWIHKWKRNGWLTADGHDVKNRELWQRLEAASADHDLTWIWTKGHNGHRENERADALARAASRSMSHAPATSRQTFGRVGRSATASPVR